eukprot:5194041-Prymnesium_polylepis.1
MRTEQGLAYIPHARMWHKCPGGQAEKRSPAVRYQSFDRVTVTLEQTLCLPTRIDFRGWLACSRPGDAVC